MRKFLMSMVALVALLVGSYAIRGSEPLERRGSPQVVATPVSPARLDEVDRLIRVFEERVANNDDALNQWTLGAHYLDRASITGAVGDYRSARDILDEARRTNAGNPRVDIPLAAARLGLHDFSGAIELLEAHLLDPSALAIFGDASLGYGEIDDARSSFERLLRIAPDDPAVTVRAASLEWATGNREAAIHLAQEAAGQAQEAGLDGRLLSFYLTHTGHLLFESGRFDEALPFLQEAVELDPTFVSPKIELAHVLAARGDVAAGVRLLEEVLSHGPNADAAVVLGDLYALSGDAGAAERSYRVLDEVAADAPIPYRRALSLFLSNHDRDPSRALRLAEEDLQARHDSGAFDALAWALYRNGRFVEARDMSEKALQLGTSDPAARFHAGLISFALGEPDRAASEVALALELNPFFNPLLAEDARSIIEGKSDMP